MPRSVPAREGTESTPPSTPALDATVAETIARHFDGSRVEGSTAHLGFSGITMDCWVNDVVPMGVNLAASLFFNLRGGPLGDVPVFASISGYGPDEVAAVVAGGCEWSCAFGPVLRAAFTHEDDADLSQHGASLSGVTYAVRSDATSKMLGADLTSDPGETIRGVYSRLAGDETLTKRVIDSGMLPILPRSVSTLLSVFVMEGATHRVVEVKVNGSDWAPAQAAFADRFVGPQGAVVLLRELAVLVPQPTDDPPDRNALQRTLSALSRRTESVAGAGWPGWHAHRGVLAPPMRTEELVALEERAGPLPRAYADFLTSVAVAGGGPGYGLLRPDRREDVIPLAHAGCGVTWVLRLDGAHYGEVWADAAGSDETFTCVAQNFTDWYLAWVDHAVRGVGPWVSWDVSACATPGVLSQVLDAHPGVSDLSALVPPRAIRLSGGGAYLPAGAALDPCQGCVSLADHFGLTSDVFSPGVLSGAGPQR